MYCDLMQRWSRSWSSVWQIGTPRLHLLLSCSKTKSHRFVIAPLLWVSTHTGSVESFGVKPSIQGFEVHGIVSIEHYWTTQFSFTITDAQWNTRIMLFGILKNLKLFPRSTSDPFKISSMVLLMFAKKLIPLRLPMSVLPRNDHCQLIMYLCFLEQIF